MRVCSLLSTERTTRHKHKALEETHMHEIKIRCTFR